MASVVVATAGVLLFASLAQITRARALAREQIVMRQILSNRLALLETVTDGEQAGGACEAPYEAYRWAMAASAGTLPSVAKVTASVTSPTGHSMDAVTIRPIRNE